MERKERSFGGQKIESLSKEERLAKAASLAPCLKRFLFFSNKNDRAFYRR
jgi:hypothetical protein